MPGASTNDTYTHIVPLPDGGELVASAFHGRVNLTRYARGRRGMVSSPLAPDVAKRLGERLIELSALAPSTARRTA